MSMKICYSKIVNGNLAIPEEILQILPQDTPLYMRSDTESGTVIIYAKDPTQHQNQWYFDEMKEEMKDVDWRTHYDDGPIP